MKISEIIDFLPPSRKIFGKQCNWLQTPQSVQRKEPNEENTRKRKIYSDKIIVLVGADNSELHVKYDPLIKGFQLYDIVEKHRGVSRQSARILCNGSLIKDEITTLKDQKIVGGSVLEFYQQQTGC